MWLSIITINLNNSKGLQKTIDSVIHQSMDNYEFIIIDGKSTDGSIDIIQQNTGKIACWISEPDHGVYNAMNNGIAQAKGEYCLFLNSGDYLVSETVLEQVFNKVPTADVIYGNLLVVSNGKVVEICKGKDHLTFLDIYLSTIKHQASFIKRELFEKYGFFDESLKIVADWAFFLKTVGLYAAYYKYLDIDITYFENNGISYNNADLCKMERQRVLDQYLPAMIQEDFLLLEKYRAIRRIDKSKLGFFLFRVLAKLFKF